MPPPTQAVDRVTLKAAPFLYAIIDASMVGSRSLTDWVRLLAGPDKASLVQWRFKGLTDAVALLGAEELRVATTEAGVLLFINDRPDIARIVGADGVHVGQEDMAPADVRSLMPGGLIGVSTHNQGQFEKACEAPVDYIAVGPVFATTSKANPDPEVGLSFVAWTAGKTTLPIVGIGGINGGNAADVTRAGASGIAVISELMKAEDPDAAARNLKSALVGRGITSRPA
ncbi:MAG: thiamine phosphate synthase [Vicinamibacteria bacterium]